MPSFPEFNDKFYEAGLRAPTFRAAIEIAAKIENAPEPENGKFDDWKDRESKSFSVLVGFVDGMISRIRR